MRAARIDAARIAGLDKTLHEPVRLCVAACLYVTDEVDFVFLQSQTGITGGNLSSHIKKLEQAEMIEVRKEFRDSKPRTALRMTRRGRAAFRTYLESIRGLIALIDQPKDNRKGKG